MRNFKDEVGNIYNRLTVLARAQNSKGGQARWFCHCECGNFATVTGTMLRAGQTQSCGCLVREKTGDRSRLSKGEASFNMLYSNYEKNACKRGYSFNLTKEQFYTLTKDSCYYCGAKPHRFYGLERLNGKYCYNGIDRIDNTKGYTMDNVVSCCWECNEKKKADTKKDFLSWVQRVYENCIEESL